ncbi:hypothetical protein FIV04_23985 (plasmid) [Vibrio sp. THAF190c]|nr:hypothetical protein FIV04_23985 [Vibrio sp. THAF190c]
MIVSNKDKNYKSCCFRSLIKATQIVFGNVCEEF